MKKRINLGKKHIKNEQVEIFKKKKDSYIEELKKTRKALLNILDDAEKRNQRLLETQELLRKMIDELKQQDLKKDEFISIAAHELKTPITSIIGFARLLEEPQVLRNEERLKKYLNIIKNDSERLANLVTDILDLSRIDMGRLKLVWSRVELLPLFKAIKCELGIILKEKKLYLAINCKKNIAITTDKERLMQILNNLIINAIHYTSRGGITIIVKDNHESITIAIRDTGAGISEEGMKKLFKRFSQVDSSITRKIGGSGLGLAISEGIIKSMGGSIYVESKEDEGSLFTITLPKKIASPEEFTSLLEKNETSKEA